MRQIVSSPRLILALSILLMVGCTKPYKILQDLERPIPVMATCAVGGITDELPVDFEEAKKPTAESIKKFRDYLRDEMSKRDVLTMLEDNDPEAQYVIRGAIIDYKKGSGTLRFLFGFGAGSAKVTVTLELADVSSNEVVFSGNFTGSVSSWAESGDKMFKAVSKNFSKAVAKRIKEKGKTS